VQSADRSKSHCVAPGRPSMAKACTTTSTFMQPFAHTLHHSPDRRVRYRDLWRRSCGRLRPAARCSTAILTIAQGTLPLGMFGPENCAYRRGLIGAPSRICQALAPLAFGLLIEPTAKWGVVASACLSLAALVALIALRQTKETQTIARAAA